MDAVQAARFSPPRKEPVEVLAPLQVYRAEDLLVWQYTLPRTEIAILPHHTCAPNAMLYGDLVITSTLAPGGVVAVCKRIGERRWLRRLATYGAKPVLAEKYMSSYVCRMLRTLKAEAVDVSPQIPPAPERREALLPEDKFSEGTIFIGDRACLSAASGKVQWAAPRNSDVSGTALAFEDSIITANYGRLALAYDQESGREIWRQELPSSSIYQVQPYDGMALAQTTEALYGLCPRTGAILRTWSWEDTEIESVAIAGSVLCVVVTNERGVRDGKSPENPWTELLGIRKETVLWRLPYPRYSGVALRWDNERQLLYEAMQVGLGVVDVETGKRLAVVQGFAAEPELDQVGLPCTDADHLYILHTSGSLWALRHPTAA